MELLLVRLMDGWMLNLTDLKITTKLVLPPDDQFNVFQPCLVTVFREKCTTRTQP